MAGAGHELSAQSFYSTDQDYLKSKNEGHNLQTDYTPHYPDTSITLFHNYFPRNFLGNTGLSSAPYYLSYGTNPLGFYFFEAPTQTDRILEKEIKYYKTKGPYADLTGIAGSKQLQIFKLNFTHSFSERMNVSLRLNRYNSTGYYLKQQSFANNILFNNSFITKRGRFGYYAFLLGNLNKNKENGGIKDSVLNDSTVWLNKGILDVKLDSAARENREMKVMFNPWFLLNRKDDSTSVVQHFLSLKSDYTSHKYRYRDQSISKDQFYDVFYFDTLRTNDSAHVQKFRNSVEYNAVNLNGLGLRLGFCNEYNRVWQKKDSVFFNQLFTGGLILRKAIGPNNSEKNAGRRIESSLNFDYVLYGPNRNNARIEMKNRLYKTGSLREMTIDLLYDSRNADHIYRNWQSNHYIWQNNFKTVDQIQARAGMRFNKKLSAYALYQSISNLVYFNEQALPAQHKGTTGNLVFSFCYSDLYVKHIGIHLNYFYQQSSSPSLIRLPQNSGSLNLFYYASLFKNNLLLQLGGQLQAYQSMESYAFMPATQVYYLQKGFKTGEYPFLDVYLNVRIRPASFFVKIENILAGYAGNNFALVQGYYQPQMAFRFGLTWLFFD